MPRFPRHLGLVFVFLVMATALPSADRPPVGEILQKMDSLYRGASSRAVMEMSIETPHWKRTLLLDAWSEGMDKTFVVVRAPKKDAGIATLRIDQEMWNFFPRINKTLKVPPSLMMGSWMGSDFTNDDLVRESSLLRDYEARYSKDPGPKGTWAVELTPRAQTPTVWARIVLFIRPDTALPALEDYYDEHGKKVRTIRYGEIRTQDGRTFPSELEMIPHQKTGQRTVLRYKELRFSDRSDPSVFTLQNLRRSR